MECRSTATGYAKRYETEDCGDELGRMDCQVCPAGHEPTDALRDTIQRLPCGASTNACPAGHQPTPALRHTIQRLALRGIANRRLAGHKPTPALRGIVERQIRIR